MNNDNLTAQDERNAFDKFLDQAAFGRSIEPGVLGRIRAARWLKQGLIRRVHRCEASSEWKVGDYVPSDRALKFEGELYPEPTVQGNLNLSWS